MNLHKRAKIGLKNKIFGLKNKLKQVYFDEVVKKDGFEGFLEKAESFLRKYKVNLSLSKEFRQKKEAILTKLNVVNKDEIKTVKAKKECVEFFEKTYKGEALIFDLGFMIKNADVEDSDFYYFLHFDFLGIQNSFLVVADEERGYLRADKILLEIKEFLFNKKNTILELKSEVGEGFGMEKEIELESLIKEKEEYLSNNLTISPQHYFGVLHLDKEKCADKNNFEEIFKGRVIEELAKNIELAVLENEEIKEKIEADKISNFFNQVTTKDLELFYEKLFLKEEKKILQEKLLAINEYIDSMNQYKKEIKNKS